MTAIPPRLEIRNIVKSFQGRRVVDDVSLSGALLTCEMQLTPGQAVEFEIEAFGRIPAAVAHIRGTLAGIQFTMDDDLAGRYAAWFAAVEKED